MRFLTHVAMLFYLTIISFVGGLAFSFAGHRLSFEDIVYFLNLAYFDRQIRIIIFAVSGSVIFLSILFAKIISGSRQKERTIAFENPSGRVSISLGALEDIIKRAVLRIIEVKEIKPEIIATKKGIEISCRLILRSETSLPDMTSRLQETIKERVQDVLGIEENVVVRIHITKIVSELGKKGKKDAGEDLEGKETLAVPFQGYRK